MRTLTKIPVGRCKISTMSHNLMFQTIFPKYHNYSETVINPVSAKNTHRRFVRKFSGTNIQDILLPYSMPYTYYQVSQ